MLRSHISPYKLLIFPQILIPNLFLAFLLLVVYTAYFIANETDSAKKTTFSLFFAGSILALGLSSLYHTLACHSSPVFSFLIRYTSYIKLIRFYVFWCMHSVQVHFNKNAYMHWQTTIGYLREEVPERVSTLLWCNTMVLPARGSV